MQEIELRLNDLFVLVLRKWRPIVCAGIVLALILGIGAVGLRVIELNDPDRMAILHAEYEVAYAHYMAGIDAVERHIRSNDNNIDRIETELANIDSRRENYKYAIEDLRADIEYFNLQIVDMEKNIEVLEAEKEDVRYRLNYRTEQNENSLFMNIDPYDVKTSEIFVRVDTGYQILPGNVYQNPDATAELLETYRLMVSNAQFYEQMIATLDLDTEVRYLAETVSVYAYNTNSLCIRVIGEHEEMTRRVAEYVMNTVLNSRSEVAAAVAAHTLEVYSRRNYSVVDMELYAQQQAHMMEAVELEGLIRELDADILNIQDAIRQTKSDVRDIELGIGDIEIQISNLPVEEEAMNEAIAAYKADNNELRIQKLDLMGKDAPSEPGLSLKGAGVRFVKFAVIGGVVGILLAAVWFVLVHVVRGKVLSGKQVAASFGITFMGVWPAGKKKKLPLACVDRWIERMIGGARADSVLVCANVAAAVAPGSRVLICGGADERCIADFAAELKKKCAEVEVSCAGSYANDPKAVEELVCSDAVVMMEAMYRSELDTISRMKDRAQIMEKPVLGVVLV